MSPSNRSRRQRRQGQPGQPRPGKGSGLQRREPDADRRRGRRPDRSADRPTDRRGERGGQSGGQRGGQRGLGGEQVEGRQAVAELLAARRRRVHDVWMSAGMQPAPILDRIDQLASEQGVTVRRVSRARLDGAARTDSPQGVLAHADPLHEADLDELCGVRPGAEPPLILALDGVTDPHNLGALLRSAEGAGATGAIVSRHRSAHVTPSATKAAAGAIEHVPIAVVGGISSALTRASEHGLWVVGLATEGGTDIHSLPLADQPIVVVVGAEGGGLARLVRQRCDVLARIPLHGRLESLNASAAGAVALFEVARRRGGGSRR